MLSLGGYLGGGQWMCALQAAGHRCRAWVVLVVPCPRVSEALQRCQIGAGASFVTPLGRGSRSEHV